MYFELGSPSRQARRRPVYPVGRVPLRSVPEPIRFEEPSFHRLVAEQELLEEREERVVQGRWEIAVGVVADLYEPVVVGHTQRLVHGMPGDLLHRPSELC
jgi:hypothetical protein